MSMPIAMVMAMIITISCFGLGCNTVVGVDALNSNRYSHVNIHGYGHGHGHATPSFVIPRGGDLISDESDSEYDLDESEYDQQESEEITDDDEDEEIITPPKRQPKRATTKLSSSTVKASSKANTQKVKTSKKIMNESLKKKSKAATVAVTAATTVTTKKKKTKRKLFSIPYILKALLNPFTVFSMTRGYFASLVNIDYLQEDASQTLRSALEEKAKKGGSSSGGAKRPGRGRKMKPGQAKTLSDLPQLNT